MPIGRARGPGRPVGSNGDETRQRIVRAALLVFSERGFGGASLQAIAARADLTRPAVNHYFSSKRVLYQEVMDETNKRVIAAGVKQAENESTLVAQLTAFISEAVRADSENSVGLAFLISGVLELQRHPDLTGTENESVRISREFLTRVVNDAIERDQLAADVDGSTLVETLLVAVCGMGLYAGYVQNHREMSAVTGMLRQLLEGVLRRPHQPNDIARSAASRSAMGESFDKPSSSTGG